MNDIEHARTRVEQAAGLTAVLDACYAAFQVVGPVIEQQQDPASAWFVPFVLAGPSAASGRLALLDAPSLPATALIGEIPAVTQLPSDAAVAAVAGLGAAVAARLDSAALAARQAADRDACGRAARHARDMCRPLGEARRHDRPRYVRRPRRSRHRSPRSTRPERAGDRLAWFRPGES